MAISRIKTWVSKEILTAADLNAEFDNIIDNLTAANVGDFSVNVAQMQTTTDPGEVGTESLATDLSGELARLRFMLAEVSGKTEWYETPANSLQALTDSIESLTGTGNNRIISGVSTTKSEMAAYLDPAGSGNGRTVSILGAGTSFAYEIEGSSYTITSDVAGAAMAAAPAANNTCDVDDVALTGQDSSLLQGENGTVLTVDAMGSQITSLVGSYAAFKTGTEYFIAHVDSSTQLSRARRGFFFDASQTGLARVALTDNDTITLMSLAYIFTTTAGAVDFTENVPEYSGDQPASPATGDYWFDIDNDKWMKYGGVSYADADATYVGLAVSDATDCLATRPIEYSKTFASSNNISLDYVSATVVRMSEPNRRISVYGKSFYYGEGREQWDMASDIDSGVSEGASTTYYMYIKDTGKAIISDVAPLERLGYLKGFYHPFETWRCVGSIENDGSSNFIDKSEKSFQEASNRLAESDADNNWVSEEFLLDGTFNCPQDVSEIFVEAVGGGGGGAGGFNGATDAGGGGGGGGSGYYDSRLRVLTTPGTAYAVTVGPAGAAGAADLDGSDGGSTLIGEIYFAPGGRGGESGSVTAGGPGGYGGPSQRYEPGGVQTTGGSTGAAGNNGELYAGAGAGQGGQGGANDGGTGGAIEPTGGTHATGGVGGTNNAGQEGGGGGGAGASSPYGPGGNGAAGATGNASAVAAGSAPAAGSYGAGAGGGGGGGGSGGATAGQAGGAGLIGYVKVWYKRGFNLGRVT